VAVGIQEVFDRRPGPARFALGDGHPNPFSLSTSIRYEIAEAGKVSLAVYDATGRIVRTLVDESLVAGFYSATWDGRTSEGNPVPNGVYFYRLTSGGNNLTAKTVLMR
jgi:flagellar hook assembly protein FlgD